MAAELGFGLWPVVPPPGAKGKSDSRPHSKMRLPSFNTTEGSGREQRHALRRRAGLKMASRRGNRSKAARRKR